MARPRSPHPTESELQVLEVLWHSGPATLREIHEAIRARRKIGLTTTLKKVQIMVDKGLVHRQAHTRPARYTAASRRTAVRGRMLKDLVARAFQGSGRALLVQAVREGIVSAEELRESQRLIDAARRHERAGGS